MEGLCRRSCGLKQPGRMLFPPSAAVRSRGEGSFFPPSSRGAYSCFLLTGGFCRCSAQTKSNIISVSSVSISLGIPCTVARYCVFPPTRNWTIMHFVDRLRGLSFHLASVRRIDSLMFTQVPCWSIPLPIWAPRRRVDSPWIAILVPGGKGDVEASRRRVLITSSRNSGEPMGMISVLWMLNLAPDAMHQVSRISWRTAGSSCFDMNTHVSSANSDTMSFLLDCGRVKPVSSDFRS
ncbi:hypothetical protein EXIGLDRAFT_810289, partial [Exidia glandulosa HHB12029]